MAAITLLAEVAADLMSRDPMSLAATTAISEAARALTTRGCGAAVVIDPAGHPIGVVSQTDLLIHARGRGMNEDATPIGDVMTTAVFSVRSDTPVKSLIEHFRALNVNHLFVTDDAGILVGVISPLDVLRKLA
ncbi:MAG TPA: CBS domain-containing protein [Urbifossiella sp.]|jgi:predicted transcriptional regulator